MQRPAGHEPLVRVRSMRHEPTVAEAKLWQALRGRRICDAKFRRQVWLGHYIADFFCAGAGLVIEVDGSQHSDQHAYDERRTAWLERHGFRVLRFWNNEVIGDLPAVLAVIVQALTLPAPDGHGAPPSPLQGEGF